ncbi:ACT domain-containing protein [Neisseria animalis]|uniref:ACT domain-containing protein n=1 Tax=Neisseria animalis TaxID=492 RepID=A0A5P3MTF4_NEIAN|nr:ACT domain-containing protein [Neisseria animalis]QEY24051.1 ACT domain-containing protein [Neisseria animalis]ROW32619.1 ACT domain-containing protein [Neisseria animalis]VEE06170.1 Uncharacterized protein conserved in bacteria [Neisseria animalis]
MNRPIRDLDVLISTMQPELHEGVYCFATVNAAAAAQLSAAEIVASIVEAEGLSVVVREETALKHGLSADFRAARITLTVHSDLAAVGLTAAFAAALGQAGISCNVVAGNCHDHIFVPYDTAEQAMGVLRALQQNAAKAV